MTLRCRHCRHRASSICRGDTGVPRGRGGGQGEDRGLYATKNSSAGGFLINSFPLYFSSNVSWPPNLDRMGRNQPTLDGILFTVHPWTWCGRSSPPVWPRQSTGTGAGGLRRVVRGHLHPRSCRLLPPRTLRPFSCFASSPSLPASGCSCSRSKSRLSFRT